MRIDPAVGVSRSIQVVWLISVFDVLKGERVSEVGRVERIRAGRETEEESTGNAGAAGATGATRGCPGLMPTQGNASMEPRS